MLTRANQGIVINMKSSYCKDRANQGRVNQGLTVTLRFSEDVKDHQKDIPRYSHWQGHN